MNTKEVLGRCWYILLHNHFRLAPDEGYEMSLAVMRHGLRGGWRNNFLMRVAPLARALMVRALIEAGDRGEDVDALVHGFVAGQDQDGAFRAPAIGAVWGFQDPPSDGYKYGSMDGANTYMTTLALITYRDRILGE